MSPTPSIDLGISMSGTSMARAAQVRWSHQPATQEISKQEHKEILDLGIEKVRVRVGQRTYCAFGD
jgi:hypothetical protein